MVNDGDQNATDNGDQLRFRPPDFPTTVSRDAVLAQ